MGFKRVFTATRGCNSARNTGENVTGNITGGWLALLPAALTATAGSQQGQRAHLVTFGPVSCEQRDGFSPRTEPLFGYRL
jgi:hypothetical protein